MQGIFHGTKQLAKHFFTPFHNALKNCDFALTTFWSRNSRMDQVKFFKGCLPQILRGPFLNNLTHLLLFWDIIKSGDRITLLTHFMPLKISENL